MYLDFLSNEQVITELRAGADKAIGTSTSTAAANTPLWLLCVSDRHGAELPILLDQLRSAGIRACGGIFPGLISGGTRHDRGIVAIPLPTETKVAIADLTAESESIAWQSQLPVTSDSAPESAVIFVDCQAKRIGELLEDVFDHYGNKISYVGAGAGYNDLRAGPTIFTEQGLWAGAALVVMVPQSSSVHARHGWKRIKGPFVASRTNGNVIQEINWEPAGTFFRSEIADLNPQFNEQPIFPDISSAYAFGVSKEDGEDVLHEPIRITDKDELVIMSGITENSVMYLTQGQPDSIISASQLAVSEYKPAPDVVRCFVLSSYSRALLLGKKFQRELDSVQQATSAFTDAVPEGVLALGEIASSGNQKPEFLNKTFAIAVTHSAYVKEKSRDITSDLIHLYELSQAVGRATSVEKTCKDFLRILLERRNLSCASIWWDKNPGGTENGAMLALLEAHPRSRTKQDSVAENHPLRQLSRTDHGVVVRFDSPHFRSLITEEGISGGAFALLPLGESGVLKLHSNSAAVFTTRYLQQLRPIAEKLATTIAGHVSFEQLQMAIDQHQSAQEKLSQTLQEREQITHGSPDLMWKVGLNSAILWANHQSTQAMGRSRDELLALPITEHFAEEDQPSINVAIKIGFATGQAELEVPLQTATGARWYHFLVVRSNTEANTAGKADAPFLIISGRDVTDRVSIANELKESRNLLRSVIDAIPIPVFWKDRESLYLGGNNAFAKDAGSSIEAIAGMRDAQLPWRDQAELYRSDDLQVMNTRSPKLNYALPQTTVDGNQIVLHASKVPLINKSNESLGVVGIYGGMASGAQTDESLKQTLSLFRATLEATADAILVVDNSGKYSQYNSQYAELWHIPQEVLMSGNDEQALESVLSQLADPDGFVSRTREITSHPDESSVDEFILNDGRFIERYSRTQYLDGTPVGRVWSFRDVTEKKKAEESIWKQANFDALTGLPNRRMLHDRLIQDTRKANRAGQPLAVMFIDLDRFKEVNDIYGHDVGDFLLKTTAERLVSCVRQSDTVARLAGDEFSIILSELEGSAGVERIARDILRKLAEPYLLGNEVVYKSASIGIALYPADGTNGQELLKNADQAMYAAKRLGRNRYNFFTPALQEAAQARSALSNDLRRALSGNQFLLHYQPIVNLSTGAVHKAEALIRWQHPVRGMINPSDFISIAEETGLIGDIGDWVFREAINQVATWRDSHDDSFQISVNNSPTQFYGDRNVSDTWFEYLQERKLPGESIVVEITEALLMDVNPIIRDRLYQFRDSGIGVSLDDFCTGYSSLPYLKKLHIDNLKIDRSFIQNLTPGSDNMALCGGIVAMAHKLGMQVIAEGVETAEQRDLLMDAGCDYAQGYFFSRPIPAGEFSDYLAAGQGVSAADSNLLSVMDQILGN